MTLPLSTKVAAIIALLLHGPALAESTGQNAASVAQTAGTVSEAAITPGIDAANAAAGMEVKFIGLVKPPSVSLEIHQDPITRFVQPIVKAAQGVAHWIASSSNRAAIAAQNTSQWIAESAYCAASAARSTSQWIAASSTSVASAAQNTSGWIASGSNAVVLGVQDAKNWAVHRAGDARTASEWVASNSSAAVFAAQDTGGWIAAKSSAAAYLAMDAASLTYRAVLNLENWSADLIKHVESHLRGDPNSEFAVLVKASGFVLTDVKVGIGLIPDLTVEFRHERDLTAAELEALKVRIDAYAATAAGPVRYFEALLLRRLSKSAQYAGGMRISEVHVDVFPLPGLKVFFDPLSVEGEDYQMVVDAQDMAKADSTGLRSVEERISKLEALLLAPRDAK